MIRQNFGVCKPEGNSDDTALIAGHIPRVVDSKAYAIAAGDRLRLTRQAIAPDESIGAFADRTGSNEDQLSAWERGASLVRPWYVTELKARFGVTQDWIYDGHELSLPANLMQRITEAKAKEATPPSGLRSRRRLGERRR